MVEPSAHEPSGKADGDATQEPPLTLRNLVATRQGILALALIVVELIGGMQVYLVQAILPVVAADLGAQRDYGFVTAAGAIANFAALPLAAGLLERFRVARLLAAFTALLIVGAVIGALAPTMGIFIVGRAVSSFAGGAMAMISMGAVAIGLDGRWRRFVLSFMAAVWIVASIAGPLYASWVTHAISWRWALVLYLPLLVAGRWVIGAHMRQQTTDAAAPLRLLDALFLAVGIGALSVAGRGVLGLKGPIVTVGLLCAGACLLSFAALRLLPQGTIRLRGSRRSAIATLFLLCGCYFAVAESLAIVVHDEFGADERGIGIVLTAGGLAWSIVGFACGLRPSRGSTGARTRIVLGLSLIALAYGLGAMLFISGAIAGHPIVIITVLWTVAGVGMGCAYLEAMSAIFVEQPDGISAPEAASAVMLAEAIPTAVTTTLATTFLATGFGMLDVTPGSLGVAIGVLGGIVALAIIPAARVRS